MDIKAIETIYKGYRFRSRLEARWAVFFDTLGIEYEYESEGLKTDFGFYLPDFYLPYFDVYFEVKRKEIEEAERKDAINKISYGAYSGEYAGMICFGDPEDNELTLYCQEINDGSAGSAPFKVEFGVNDNGEPVLRRIGDRRDRRTFSSWGKEVDIPTERDDYSYVPQVVIDARRKARQARFEHGEKP